VRLVLVGVLSLLLAIGVCWWGSGWIGGATKMDVRGDVTLDGQPLADGSILLVPNDPNAGNTTGGQIANGQYLLTGRQAVIAGVYKVEIRATKKSGRKVQKAMGQPGELTDEMVEAVASRFNSASVLTVVVEANPTTADFKVFGK
jgi:hypothetical protein